MSFTANYLIKLKNKIKKFKVLKILIKILIKYTKIFIKNIKFKLS